MQLSVIGAGVVGTGVARLAIAAGFGRPDRRTLPIAGDDATARAQMANLLDELGYDAVDAGPLSEGWRFERAKPADCRPLGAAELQDAVAAADREDEAPDGSWRTLRDVAVRWRKTA